MMKLSSAALFALIAASAVACAKPDPEKTAKWNCTSVDVPMGEVIRCVQNSLTIEPTTTSGDSVPAPTSDLGMIEPCSGAYDNPEICMELTSVVGGAGYDCTAAGDCPSPTTSTTPTGGAGADSTSPSGSTTSTDQGTGGTPTGGAGGDNNSTSTTNSNGNGNGAGGNGNGPHAGDQGGANPRGGRKGPDECEFTPELGYCGNNGNNGNGGSSSSAGGGGSTGGNNGPNASSQGSAGTPNGGPSTGGSTSGVCTPAASPSSGQERAATAASGILCTDKPLGNPTNECAYFGLTPSGKDDGSGGLTQTATQSAPVVLVKSGTKGCPNNGDSAYQVYTGVTAGQTLTTPAGQGISHVTYCAGTPAGGAAPAPAAPAAESGGEGGTCASTTVTPKFNCKQDKKGNKVCESAPICGAGTHLSACGACVEDGTSDDCLAPKDGGCWVTGGGFIVEPSIVPGAPADGHDNFGGNAKPMKDGHVQGHWNHVDHGTMNHAKGKPEYIVCRHVDEPGPGGPGAKKGFIMNQVYFGGPAEWRIADQGDWQSGYWFDVVAKDHGEPGSVPTVKNGFMPDTYHFTIRLMDDAAHQVSGKVVYETKGTLQGGNIQMHPPNGGHPGTNMSLPSWVAFEP